MSNLLIISLFNQLTYQKSKEWIRADDTNKGELDDNDRLKWFTEDYRPELLESLMNKTEIMD